MEEYMADKALQEANQGLFESAMGPSRDTELGRAMRALLWCDEAAFSAAAAARKEACSSTPACVHLYQGRRGL